MNHKMKCKTCNKQLGNMNQSGYCEKCYLKSSKYLEYQRKSQKAYYNSCGGREKIKARQKKNKVKIAKYMKRYHKKHADKIREQKKEWARKNRLKNRKA